MTHFKNKSISSRLFILGFLLITIVNTSNSQVIYDVPGTYTWIVPPCVTSVTVQAWGGGGGGGGVASYAASCSFCGYVEACSAAGGGGGGGFVSRTYTVIPGESYTIVVGAGGISGPATNNATATARNGGNGGTSTFSGPSTISPGTLTAFGGNGGQGARTTHGGSFDHYGTNGTGGTGGTGANGTTTFTGGTGATGMHSASCWDLSGGGGGAAGTSANGGNAQTLVCYGGQAGGTGGATAGGAGGAGKADSGTSTQSFNGNNGVVIGGAGGGALIHLRDWLNSWITKAGGTGARGEVRLSFTTSSLAEPLFSAVGPICSGDILTALPTTSNNGYSGTWSPALNNSATTTYVFTPNPSGPCADTASLKIVVNPATVPTFTAIAPICNGGSLAALPTTSNNSIMGTWSPALNNTTTTVYTFLPTAGQCASTTTLTITVGPPVTPAFTAVSPICNGGSLAALPSTSNNSITGTWSPALNNTATTVYTFSPTAGQCATTTTLTITVNPSVTPTFTAVSPICSGGSLTALPTTSNNSITGTWSPALDNTTTTVYTFLPTVGQCATTTTLTITVNPSVTPTFTAVAPICNGGSLAALPTTSNNSITGTWSPALDNTTTTVYTFLPTAGQCATTTTLTISVGPPATPTFTAVSPICNSAPLAVLPTTSNNGFNGTWSPALDNTTTTVYTFLPTAGQCATTTTLTITVNQLPVVDAGNYTSVCRDAASIPLVGSPVGGTFSGTGVTGSNFSPSQGTQTITYTYTDGNGCTNADNSVITIFNLPTINAGNDINSCEGQSVTLAGTGGVSYVWNNGGVNGQSFTPTVGQTSYTVTGTDANGCVNTDNIIVTVADMPYAELVPDNTTGSPGLTVNFENNSSVTPNYAWNFGNGDTEITTNLISTSSTYNNPGTYIVILTVTNGTCTDYDTVQIVIIEDPEPVIEVPNVFTPNGDASNNQFFIDAKFTSNIKYIIVNRWGNLIFEADGVNPLWDGTSKGKPVVEGVYFYKYEVLGMNGKVYTGHGNVTVIRN